MSRRAILSSLILGVLASSPLCAQESEKIPEWKSKVELGYNRTWGNTETTTFSGQLNTELDAVTDRYIVKGNALYAKSDSVETSNRWLIEGRYEKPFTERFFAFAGIDYLKDKFSGYNYRVTAGPGVGYEFIKTDRHKLKGLASILYSYDRFSEGEKKSDSYTAGKTAVDYAWQIANNLKFLQYADFKISFKDSDVYTINTETALEAGVSANAAVGLHYLIYFQHDVPSDDVKQSDHTLIASLTVNF